MAGRQTGFAFCPAGEAYAKAHGAWVPSWEALLGDLWLFDWNRDGVADHVEMVTSRSGSLVYTIGGDSGASNVDNYRGQGGVHRHEWSDPVGSGNPLILGAINCGKLVTFASVPPPHLPTVPAWYHRLLAFPVPSTNPGATRNVSTAAGVKPMQHGSDVGIVQRKVGAGGDDLYGPGTRDKVKTFQTHHGLLPDGVVGVHTATALGA